MSLLPKMNEILQLVGQGCDDELGTEDVMRLESLMQNDAAAQQYYLQLVELDMTMSWRGRDQSNSAVWDQAKPESSRITAQELGLQTPMRPERHARRLGSRSISLIASVQWGCIVLAVIFALVAANKWTSQTQEKTVGTPSGSRLPSRSRDMVHSRGPRGAIGIDSQGDMRSKWLLEEQWSCDRVADPGRVYAVGPNKSDNDDSSQSDLRPIGEESVRLLPVSRIIASSEASAQHGVGNLINGLGMTEHGHINRAENAMWLSEAGKIRGEMLLFDLGALYGVGAIAVWNYNEAAGDRYRTFGVARADVYVSSSGKGNPHREPGEWKLAAKNFVFRPADGSESYRTPDVIRIDGIAARYVAIVIGKSFSFNDEEDPGGGVRISEAEANALEKSLGPGKGKEASQPLSVGLSEVQIFGGPVKEKTKQ